jgi:FdhD protein
MKAFHKRSLGYRETGGVHSAALAEKDNILIVREDIGRHNTVDKILGYAMLNSINLSDKVILISGRISSEIVLKTIKTKIPMIVSRSAPTDQAVEHARDSNITLIGFVRGQRMNVYSGLGRIT